MNLSSGSGGIEPFAVVHHGPQHIDPPASEGDHRLAVLFPFGSLALVVGPRLRGAQLIVPVKFCKSVSR